MVAFYGLIVVILIGCLFKRKWKVSGIVFIILLFLTPFAGKASENESIKNYELGITAMKNKEYNKAEELFNKVENYNDNTKKYYEFCVG